MQGRREWSLPDTFKELKSFKEVVEVWEALRTVVVGMGVDDTEELSSPAMEVALGQVKALLPWVEKLWYSVDAEVGVGVSGQAEDEYCTEDGLLWVRLVALTKEIRSAVEADRGVGRAVLQAFCQVILEEQIEGLGMLLKVRTRVQSLLSKSVKNSVSGVRTASLGVSPLQIGGSVLQELCEKRRGSVLELFQQSLDEECTVLWMVAVEEELGGAELAWSIQMEEGRELSFGVKERVDLEMDFNGAESLTEVFSAVEDKRREYARMDFQC